MFLNENLDDPKRFELYYEDPRKGKVTFQARSVPLKEAWCDLLRRWLRKWGRAPEIVSKLEKVSIKGSTYSVHVKSFKIIYSWHE